MLKFLVYEDGKPAEKFPLRNVYLIGPDQCPVRGTIKFENGMIICEKRESLVVGLVLQQKVGNCGELTLQTTRLPDRDEPYLLNLELARHRLMTLYAKLEDWAKFEMGSDHPAIRRADVSRKFFVEALCYQKENPVKAEKLAGDALVVAIDGSEELAISHSELLLSKRKSTAALPKRPLGCGVAIDQTSDRLRAALHANFDFINLPTPWNRLVVEEGDYHFEAIDHWVEWATRNKMPIVGGPIISFDTSQIPNWLFIWEHDYDTIRELIYEHVERVVTRYKGAITTWNVVSGLHINSHFTFNLDQLMDLTRMTTMLVKKIQPAGQALIEIRQPYGEYFASNVKSVTPLLYTDLLIQRQINFDGLQIKYPMGQAVPGQYSRDLMQLSTLVDYFATFGKPIHLVLGVPSEPVTTEMIAVPEFSQPVDPNAGYWRMPWSPKVQAHFLEASFQIALSKPYVESVSWQEIMDHPNTELPMAGLINDDFQPKPVFRNLVVFKKNLYSTTPIPSPTAKTSSSSQASNTGSVSGMVVDLPPKTDRVDPG